MTTQEELTAKLFSMIAKLFQQPHNYEWGSALHPSLTLTKLLALDPRSSLHASNTAKEEQHFQETFTGTIELQAASQLHPLPSANPTASPELHRAYFLSNRELMLFRIFAQHWLLNNIIIGGKVYSLHSTYSHLTRTIEKLEDTMQGSARDKRQLLFIDLEWIMHYICESKVEIRVIF